MAAAAGREEVEIAVVGAGPAGCTTAAVLAELGHEVLLLDKDPFPREKPCGDGILHPAVAVAERLGLQELFAPGFEIDSTRIVVGHRRQTSIPFARVPGRPLPRCVPRRDFDAALLEAAQARGARFLRARVESLGEVGGRRCLTAVGDEGPLEIEAGFVVAADGATSRLRRVAKSGAEKPRAYAIRCYYRTEKAIDPVYHADLPLEVDGRILAGYGWVFPIDEHVANIGIGISREPHRRTPSLRRMLEAYVAELETKARRRFGDLEPIGEPLGAPVGIRPRVETAGHPGLALIGDAAGTTHPWTGEGISFAMCGAETLAKALHRRAARPRGAAASDDVEAEVWRAFPQVGIDTAVAVRISTLKSNQAPAPTESVHSVSEPFLSTIWRIVPESAYDTGVDATPAWLALDGCDSSLSASLERANGLLLERLSDRMPFVTEVIHDSIRGHLGPMYAAAVLATAANGSELPEGVYDAGVSAETVGVLPKLLTMLVDRASSNQLKVNNAWAVLTGDFAATRALSAAAKLGPAAVTALSRACKGGCEGGMRDAAARFAADRTPQSWLEAAQETEGAAMLLATEFGAIVRGRDAAAAAPLREFGIELGVAVRLAEEIVELTVGACAQPGEEGAALGRGIYSLPVLYAVEAEPSLPRLLARHTAEQQGAAEIIGIVRDSGALERALAECGERAARARACAETWAENDGGALAALAAVPPEYVASRVPADVLEAL